MLHDGENHYKEFYKFVISTMNLIKKSDVSDKPSDGKDKNLILVPKSMISKSSLEKLSLVYNLDFSVYQRRGKGSVITKIEREISFKIRPTNAGEIDFSEFKKTAETVIQEYSPAETGVQECSPAEVEHPTNNQVEKANTPQIKKFEMSSN